MKARSLLQFFLQQLTESWRGASELKSPSPESTSSRSSGSRNIYRVFLLYTLALTVIERLYDDEDTFVT